MGDSEPKADGRPGHLSCALSSDSLTWLMPGPPSALIHHLASSGLKIHPCWRYILKLVVRAILHVETKGAARWRLLSITLTIRLYSLNGYTNRMLHMLMISWPAFLLLRSSNVWASYSFWALDKLCPDSTERFAAKSFPSYIIQTSYTSNRGRRWTPTAWTC